MHLTGLNEEEEIGDHTVASYTLVICSSYRAVDMHRAFSNPPDRCIYEEGYYLCFDPNGIFLTFFRLKASFNFKIR